MNSNLNPTEKKFEKYIEDYLNSKSFKSIDFREYDRNLCLIKNGILEFIKITQKNKWEKLQEIYGDDVEKKVLNRISS